MRLNVESGKNKGVKRIDNNHYCYEDNTNCTTNSSNNSNSSSNQFLGVRWHFNHKENHRYYVLMIQKDLFETIIVTKIWGSTDRKGNRVVHMPFNTESEALVYVDKIKRIRERRGYELAVDDK